MELLPKSNASSWNGTLTPKSGVWGPRYGTQVTACFALMTQLLWSFVLQCVCCLGPFYLSFGIKHMFAQFSDFSKPVFQYNKMYSHRNSCYVCRPAFVVGLYIGVARFFGLQAARFHLFCFLFYEYVQRHIVEMLVSIHVTDSFLSCVLERV